MLMLLQQETTGFDKTEKYAHDNLNELTIACRGHLSLEVG